MTHVGRYAPSPSGDLHVGNARTALLAWLWARGDDGRFLLRIEDLDPERSQPALVRRLVEDLTALGIDWDEEPVFQSRRGDALRPRARAARAREPRLPVLLLACRRARGRGRTARRRHARAIPVPVARSRPARSSGGSRAGERASLRFRSADGRDDHVLRRSDGVVGYQLAVVVDDAEQGVNHVLRGDDLASSTPLQIELWHALGFGAPPRYLHVPLVLDRDGRRLGKRHGSLTIRTVLADGALARASRRLARVERGPHRIACARAGSGPRRVVPGGVPDAGADAARGRPLVVAPRSRATVFAASSRP